MSDSLNVLNNGNVEIQRSVFLSSCRVQQRKMGINHQPISNLPRYYPIHKIFQGVKQELSYATWHEPTDTMLLQRDELKVILPAMNHWIT